MYIRTKSFLESSGCRTCPLEMSERRALLTHYWCKSKCTWLFLKVHTTSRCRERCHTYERVMSQIRMSHVTHMNESCHRYGWVKSHEWMSDASCINVSCLTSHVSCVYVMSHISCVMSHISYEMNRYGWTFRISYVSMRRECLCVCACVCVCVCHMSLWDVRHPSISPHIYEMWDWDE